MLGKDAKKLNQQQTIKNSPDFYQKAPFLTIAKEILMLIKTNKVEMRIYSEGVHGTSAR